MTTVIDAHNHYGSMAATGMDVGSHNRAAAIQIDRDIENRMAALEAEGIEKAIIIAGHGYLRPDGLADTQRVNNEIADYRNRRPDRFPAAIGVVEPYYGERGIEELLRCKLELGIAGISFHSRFQGVPVDSPWMRRYLEAMGELDLVPFIHSMGESPEEALWKVEGLARDLPDLTMLILDAFGTFEQSLVIADVAARRSNLVFDTALADGAGPVLDVIDRCGASRIVFGSDMYSSALSGSRSLSHLLGQLRRSDLPPHDLEAVLNGNIRSLLDLDLSKP